MSDPYEILAIDLGTGTCLACVMRGDAPIHIKPDPKVETALMNSVYLAVPDGKGGHIDLVGPDAERVVDSGEEHAAHLVRDVKRRLRFKDNPAARLVSNGKRVSPVEVSTHFLVKLRREAEAQLGYTGGMRITRAVVTVPSDFGTREITATRQACLDAGFHETYLLDEPVAVAYSLVRERSAPGSKLALIADLGQGTFDLALMRLGRDAGRLGISEVARGGDSTLGGRDWDREIAEFAVDRTTPLPPPLREAISEAEYEAARLEYESLGTNQEDQIRTLLESQCFGREQLWKSSEEAKREFYALGEEQGLPGHRRVVYRPFPSWLPAGATIQSIDFARRTDFLHLRCLIAIERLLREASAIERRPIDWSSLEEIYLAGGGSHMWTIGQAIRGKWGRTPVRVPAPQFAVVKGAALYARDIRDGVLMPGDSILARPRAAHTIGLRFVSENGAPPPDPYVLVHRNTPLPAREVRHEFWMTGSRRAKRLRLEFVERKFHAERPENGHDRGDYLVQEKWEEFRTRRFDIPPADGPSEDRERLTLVLGYEPDGVPEIKAFFRGRMLTDRLD